MIEYVCDKCGKQLKNTDLIHFVKLMVLCNQCYLDYKWFEYKELLARYYEDQNI